MKQFKSKKKMTGSYIVEISAGLGILLLLTAYGFSKQQNASEKGDEAVLVNEISTIVEGARKFRGTVNNGYADISMTLLSDDQFITTNLGNGTGKNPFGGNYTVTVAGTGTPGVSNSRAFDFKASGLPASVCERLGAMYAKTGTATCSTGTVSLTTS